MVSRWLEYFLLTCKTTITIHLGQNLRWILIMCLANTMDQIYGWKRDGNRPFKTYITWLTSYLCYLRKSRDVCFKRPVAVSFSRWIWSILQFFRVFVFSFFVFVSATEHRIGPASVERATTCFRRKKYKKNQNILCCLFYVIMRVHTKKMFVGRCHLWQIQMVGNGKCP